MSNIKCVRMASGEDIIGEIVYQNDNLIEINTPMEIVYDFEANPEEQVAAFIGLKFWSFIGKRESVTVSRSHIYFITPPRSAMEQFYIEVKKNVLPAYSQRIDDTLEQNLQAFIRNTSDDLPQTVEDLFRQYEQDIESKNYPHDKKQSSKEYINELFDNIFKNMGKPSSNNSIH